MRLSTALSMARLKPSSQRVWIQPLGSGGDSNSELILVGKIKLLAVVGPSSPFLAAHQPETACSSQRLLPSFPWSARRFQAINDAWALSCASNVFPGLLKPDKVHVLPFSASSGDLRRPWLATHKDHPTLLIRAILQILQADSWFSRGGESHCDTTNQVSASKVD